MTKDEWNNAAKALSVPYGYAKFNIDGYEVTVSVQEEKPLKYILMIYVNGKIKMDWCINNCDIRNRFFWKTTHCLFTGKDKKSKEYRQLTQKEKNEVLEQFTYETFYPYFNTFKTMKSHFLKANDKIELVGYYGDRL